MRFGTIFSREWENIRQLQNKSISNETASQEKQFKHIFRVGVRISQTMAENLSPFLTN